jgi:hypothetical protein
MEIGHALELRQFHKQPQIAGCRAIVMARR